jgi:hypothetical protein
MSWKLGCAPSVQEPTDWAEALRAHHALDMVQEVLINSAGQPRSNQCPSLVVKAHACTCLFYC